MPLRRCEIYCQWRTGGGVVAPLSKLPPAHRRPASAFVAFRRDAYAVTEGAITKFNSSPGRLRGFCAKCGSTLTCEGENSPEMHFHIGAFDEAARLEPTRHIFPEERLPWLHLAEASPA